MVIYQSICLETGGSKRSVQMFGQFRTYRRQYRYGDIGFSKAVDDFGSIDHPSENVRPNSYFRHDEK